jgi:dihydrolipoamide dehydrogenase
VIIGGVIIELGQVFTIGSASFCCRIFRPNYSRNGRSCSKELTKVLKKQGMKFYVSHKVKSVERNGEGVVVQLKMQKEKTLHWKEIIH